MNLINELSHRVVIVNTGKCYPYYESLITDYFPQYLSKFTLDEVPSKYARGTIVGSRMHDIQIDKLSIFIEDNTGNCYIMGQGGFKDEKEYDAIQHDIKYSY